MNASIFSSAVFWLLLSAVIALYCISAFLRVRKAKSPIWISAANAVLNVGLILSMLILKAKPDELFLTLLTVTLVAVITTGIKAKEGGNDGI